LRPVNAYGEQKAAAEKLVLARGFTVVRLPYMAGRSLTGKEHFYDSILKKLQNGEEVGMIDGMTRSVLSFHQTASIILKLLHTKKTLPNVINIASDTPFTKYEMGCAIAEKYGFPTDNIKKIPPEEGKKFFKEKRADSAVMNNGLLKKVLGLEKIDWEV